MTQALRIQTAQGRFGTVLLMTFGGLATTLAAVGLYGVLAFTVGRRKREIAIRMAVGAEAPEVRRLVVTQGMKLAGLGLLLGLGGALALGRALQAFLFRVEAVDWPTYAAVAAIMTLVAFTSTYLPARRASRVDPQRALSTE